MFALFFGLVSILYIRSHLLASCFDCHLPDKAVRHTEYHFQYEDILLSNVYACTGLRNAIVIKENELRRSDIEEICDIHGFLFTIFFTYLLYTQHKLTYILYTVVKK